VNATPPDPSASRTPLQNLLEGLPSVPVPPAIAARFRITPEQVNTAAKNFAVGQHDLADAWMRLSGALDGAAGMAGDDKPGHMFAAHYEAAVRVAWKAFAKAIVVLGGTSLGLSQTVNNHLAADHHSRADRPASAPDLFPKQQVYPNMSVAPPPSVIGAGDFGALGGIGGHFNALVSKYWPQAHTGKLSASATAWRTAAAEVQKIASWLDWTISGLTDTNDGSDIAAIDSYWGRIYRPGDTHTILSGLSEVCSMLGDACDRFASLTDKARTKVNEKTILAEIQIALTLTVVGKALKTALAGIARVTLIAVDAIATRILADETVAAIEAATDAAPTVEAVEANFEQTAAKALDSELAETESMSPLEGRREYIVDDPADPGRTITDIDSIENGVLWEEKSPIFATDANAWVAKNITKKFARYMEARQYIPGYERAPIGFNFTRPGVEPELRNAIEAEIARLRAQNPDVTILLKWAP
jgi:hypothetical protein